MFLSKDQTANYWPPKPLFLLFLQHISKFKEGSLAGGSGTAFRAKEELAENRILINIRMSNLKKNIILFYSEGKKQKLRNASSRSFCYNYYLS
jgi:hypothetical protein